MLPDSIDATGSSRLKPGYQDRGWSIQSRPGFGEIVQPHQNLVHLLAALNTLKARSVTHLLACFFLPKFTQVFPV